MIFQNRKEDKIPDGPYCHGELIPRKDGLGYERLNPCPYWKWRELHWWDMIWILWRERDILKVLKPLYNAKTYWQLFKKLYKEEKEHGVFICKYLHYKDTYQGESLLWDECKECQIKDDDYE